jgi:nucleoside-diphosphate-sugar epimerase
MYRRLKSGRFGVVGKGDNRIPRVHVEDCAEAFALVVDKLPTGESFIVADDTPCTSREFTEFMAECANMSRPRTIPKLLARLILGRLLVETMDMDCVVSNEKAKNLLGWELKYPSYREGLVAAMREIESMAI